jgi:serine O-acetyltransferase
LKLYVKNTTETNNGDAPAMAAEARERQPGLIALIREDWETHRRSVLRPGFQAMLSYRVGRWAAERRRRRLPAYVFASALHLFVRNFYGIDLYWTTLIGRRFHIGHQGAIVIHRFCTIGDDCTIRQGVTIGAADEWNAGGGPRLGDRVDVGAGAMVLGDISIGSDVRIGPNAVVTTDVPDNATVFAPPSRSIAWGGGA